MVLQTDFSGVQGRKITTKTFGQIRSLKCNKQPQITRESLTESLRSCLVWFSQRFSVSRGNKKKKPKKVFCRSGLIIRGRRLLPPWCGQASPWSLHRVKGQRWMLPHCEWLDSLDSPETLLDPSSSAQKLHFHQKNLQDSEPRLMGFTLETAANHNCTSKH